MPLDRDLRAGDGPGRGCWRNWEIAGYLGHSHERTTELYSHHSPNYLERARKAFD